MEILDIDSQDLKLMKSSSITDLRAKLFPKEYELDRSIQISQDKYSTQVLVGNWFERRLTDVVSPDDWKTIYQSDFKQHVSDAWKENEIIRWDNLLNIEGLPWEELLESTGKEYFSNMSSATDLKYNILPKNWDSRKLRSYNARKMGWVPEEDLTISYGNVTNFGLRDMLKRKWDEESEERDQKCRWRTVYNMDISVPQVSGKLSSGKFRRKRADWKTPDIEHFKTHKPDLRPCHYPFVVPTAIIN